MSIVGKDGENAKGHAAVTGHRAYLAGSSEYCVHGADVPTTLPTQRRAAIVGSGNSDRERGRGQAAKAG